MADPRCAPGWLVGLFATVLGCAADAPPPLAPPPSPAPAVDPPRLGSPEYTLDQPAPGPGGGEEQRVAANARPTHCVGTDQPAVVGFEMNGYTVGPPVWGCYEGCGPGFEYVTNVHTHRGHKYVNATCEPVCLPGTHRVSYSIVEHAESCGPGPSGVPEADAAVARDQQRQAGAYVARRAARVSGIEGDVARFENASRPWNGEVLVAWRSADGGLRGLGRGDDVVDRRSSYGRDAWGPDAEARQNALDRLVSAGAPALPAKVLALRKRVERARPLAEEAERREAFTKRRADCEERCEQSAARCAEVCSSAGSSACEACPIGRDACEGRCAKR